MEQGGPEGRATPRDSAQVTSLFPALARTGAPRNPAGIRAVPPARNAPAGESCNGVVYLVGSGPGNPELLTLRAWKLMQLADVVLHDHLVAPAIVDMVRHGAQRIYVGKERSNHTLPQGEINQLMVRLAREGKRVLRLKGGDPFIFGRGGEEIETLAAAGIRFEIVPGVTAATGVAAYAGIPLTHRDYAQACIFVTGHLKDGTMNLDWPALARPHQTVVVYMGLLGLPVLCQQLVVHGLPAATPAAVVQQGTTPEQRVVCGTLETLPLAAFKAGLEPPTLIIVGEVVKLRAKFAWFSPHGAARTDGDEPAILTAR
jgi:uroporphyrin-III C-methyltransferase/precorrin-2 dehydrogenase/sirohydrochlorin ferrochelatase